MDDLLDEQVEKIMVAGKVSDLAKLSDQVFGCVICRIYAARMEAQGIRCYDPDHPVTQDKHAPRHLDPHNPATCETCE
jgi:hypothetical protein